MRQASRCSLLPGDLHEEFGHCQDGPVAEKDFVWLCFKSLLGSWCSLNGQRELFEFLHVPKTTVILSVGYNKCSRFFEKKLCTRYKNNLVLHPEDPWQRGIPACKLQSVVKIKEKEKLSRSCLTIFRRKTLFPPQIWLLLWHWATGEDTKSRMLRMFSAFCQWSTRSLSCFQLVTKFWLFRKW